MPGRNILDVPHLLHPSLVFAPAHDHIFRCAQLDASRGYAGQSGHFGAAKVPLHEQRSEGGPELFRHQTVQHESHGGVDQRQQIHQLSKRRIAVGEEALLHHSGQQTK